MNFLKIDELRWINNYLGFSPTLDKEDLEQLKLFTFMWDMFEAKACKGVSKGQNIADFVLHELKIESLNRSDSFVDAYYNYFKKRYIESNKTNEIFKRLTMNADETFKNGNNEFVIKDFIENVLLEENPTEKNRLLASLLIVYKLRCNFFLRSKNIINVHSQYRNFTVANHLIASILDKYKKQDLK
ncbi:hypothetical protein [Clostridium hydrogeniformans]|uniref:hypothetical protein n=1 Tax=Clostridium hydrogeniformans TaxID=349933 RepID=UPI0004840478|nr:hypothetical protein [Clostridium hydrogeniformans]